MKHTIMTAVLAVTLITGTCFAEDTEPANLNDFSFRVALGSAPGTDEFEVDGFGGKQSLDPDDGARLEILAVKRFWGKNESIVGGMFGGGMFYAEHSGTDAVGADIDTYAFGLLLQGGPAIRVGKLVVIETGPYLGLGIAYTEIDEFVDGYGTYALFGLKIGVFISLAEHIELGLEAGYESFATEQELDIYGSDADIIFYGTGSRVAGVLVIKF